MICIALVMLMQAGFLCLETGLTRSKNNINVAVKNLADLGLSVLLFWAIGFGLIFGSSSGGWFGGTDFFSDLTSMPGQHTATFLFQALFCGAAVTIMSGAVAERLRFVWYLAIAAGLAGLVYPLLAHWIWNEDGWLADLGFVDFAGATVVHSLGGWAGLAIILILGPRQGRFRDGRAQQMSGSNLPFATLGALLLWCGWAGFNGGSVGRFDDRVVGVVANTVVAGAAGLLVALVIGWRRSGLPRVTDPINGMLAGLVAVTASAHAVSTASALLIGSGGAVCMAAVEVALERRQVDDAVSAVPVHLGAGVWGTLAVALFADSAVLGVDRSRLGQLGIQALGVVVAAVWVFGLVFVLCWVGNRWWPLRVSEEDEEIGLNVAEHGASTDLMDLLRTMEVHATTGELSGRVPESPFSEAGQIGRQYNRVIDALHRTEADLGESEREGNLDPLTRILNRRGLSATLEALSGSPMTVLMFDVIRFGSINGTLGYNAGDSVLVEIANHIGRRLGSNWWFGRWGGDEFLAISDSALEVPAELVSAVACRLPSGGHVKVGLRAGFVHPDVSASPDEIVRQASYALDEAKRSGDELVSFAGRVSRSYQRSSKLAASLGGSLSSLRIVPVAQTIVSNGEVIGAEMLARWPNDDGSLTSPAEFLPILIEHGLMYELDLLMIEEGVTFAARFNDMLEPLWVSVNVSASHLGAASLVNHVAAVLAEKEVDPTRLVLEITEAEQVMASAHWLANAELLRSMGVGLAIDDFGSGYSGIERMSIVPLTHVKFDGDLIRSADGPMGGIVKSVVEYTRGAGMIPVAEGVETAHHRSAVVALGIDAMQGFLFSRPEPLDDVERAVRGDDPLGQAADAAVALPTAESADSGQTQ